MINLLRNTYARLCPTFSSAVLLIILLFIATGCEHREFQVESPSKRVSVVVEFDWSLAPDANPSEMTVYFFRMGSTSRPIAYDLKGKEGGTITLTSNVYAAICHNNDSDRHGFVGYNSFDEFGIHLNDNVNTGNMFGTSSLIKAADERIAHTPDYMWVAAIASVEIKSANELSGDAPQVVRFVMQPVVSHYTFHINNPVNFNKSLSVSATISGMASTLHPGLGMTGDETVTHLFEMSPTPDGNLFGEILTFGHCGSGSFGSRDDDSSTPHILTIYATMNDGKRWNSVHDVTNQIHGSENQDCVIRLDSVAFPKPAGSGLQPTVGGWTGSQEPVGM